MLPVLFAIAWFPVALVLSAFIQTTALRLWDPVGTVALLFISRCLMYSVAFLLLYGAALLIGRLRRLISSFLDERRWAILKALVIGFLAFGSLNAAVDDTNRMARQYNQLLPERPSLLTLGAWRAEIDIFSGAISLSITSILILRIKPIRVLILRSFSISAKDFPDQALRDVLSFLGRVDAFRSLKDGAVEGWGIKGHPKKWPQGVRRVLKSVRLVVIDISAITDGLELEIDHVVEHGARRLCIRYGEMDPNYPIPQRLDGTPVVVYKSADDAEFIRALLHAIQPTDAEWIRWRKWRQHCRKFGVS